MPELRMNDGESILANIRHGVDVMLGGEGTGQVFTDAAQSGGQMPGGGQNMMMMFAAMFMGPQAAEQFGQMMQNFADGVGGGASPQVMQDPIAGSGRIWGDPHFIGADGGQYDVQGEAGKTYNLLSDAGFQMNGKFYQPEGTRDGTTVVKEVGIIAGENQIEVSKNGTVTVNGRELEDGETVQLRGGGSVSVSEDGRDVEVEHGEWKVDFDVHEGRRLDLSVSTSNAVADGVKPHGLLGQTFDGDGEARNGDRGSGRQGGGAIEDADGNITDRGDRETVEIYEVDSLFDANFTTHNQFHDGDAIRPMESIDMREFSETMMQGFMMAGFMMLSQSSSQMQNALREVNQT